MEWQCLCWQTSCFSQWVIVWLFRASEHKNNTSFVSLCFPTPRFAPVDGYDCNVDQFVLKLHFKNCPHRMTRSGVVTGLNVASVAFTVSKHKDYPSRTASWAKFKEKNTYSPYPHKIHWKRRRAVARQANKTLGHDCSPTRTSWFLIP